jgi:prophage regulatory protein
MTHTGNILSLLRAYDIVLDTPTVTPSFLDLRGNFITVQIPRGTCRNPSIAMLLYSPQHTARLEKAGLFPKRVQLGPNRVGWVESEVLEWLEQRLAQREVLN